MARKVKITSYMKNVGHSLGYVLSDVVGDYAPTAKSIVSDTKSTYQDIKFSMQDIKKNNISDAVKKFKSGPSILSNTIEDLTTGKWYNKEREEQGMEDMFGFDFDIDDFGSDEDWGDDLEDTNTESMMEHDEMNTREVISSMGRVSSDISKSVGYASAQSAKYIVANNNIASRALYDLNAKGFNQVSSILLNMSDTMVGLSQLGQPLAAHMQNSAMFFTKTTESLNKMTESLNKMNENLEILTKRTAYMENTPNKEAKSAKNGYDRFMSGGTFDLGSYIDMVKENVKDKSDTVKSMVDMMEMMFGKNGKNTSLTQMAIKFGVDKLIPQITKDITKQLDEALTDTLGNGLMRLGKAGRNKGGIIGLLADIFLPKENIKNGINTANYEKGPMQWDGVARQSLTYVIPTYLAQMTALLAGVEDQDDYQYYDFNTGKFTSRRVYKRKREEDDRRRAKQAGGDFERDALKSTDNAKVRKEIEEYFYQAMKNGGDFYNIRKGKTDKEWRKKYGNMSDEALDILISLYDESYNKKGPYKGRNNARQMEARMNSAIAENARRMGVEEASGMSFLNHFYDSSDNFIYMPAMGGVTSRGKRKGTIPKSRYSNNTSEKQSLNAKYKRQDDGTYIVGKNKTTLSEEEFEKWLDAFNNQDQDLMEKIENTNAMQNFGKYIKKQGKKVASGFFEDDNTNIPEESEKPESIMDKLKKAKDIIQSPIYAATMAMDTLSRGLNRLFYGEHGEAGLIDSIKDKLKSTWESIDKAVGITDILEKGKKNSTIRSMLNEGKLPTDTVDVQFKTLPSGRDIYYAVDSKGQKHLLKDPSVVETWQKKLSSKKTLMQAMSDEWQNLVSNAKNAIGSKLERSMNSVREGIGAYRDSEGFKSGSGSGLLISGGDSDADEKAQEVKDKLKAKAHVAKEKAQGKANEAKDTIAEGTKNLFNGMSRFISEVFIGKDPKKEQTDTIDAIKKNAKAAFGDLDESKGAMAIGGIAGAGVSLLTGAVVGPLAGAAIGAGVGLATKSKAFQNFLFGEGDPDSEDYKKGLLGDLGKKLKDKNNQDILKGAGIGGGIGLVGGTLMGSPILGMIAGSTVGYIAKSEKAQKFLFGDEDNKTALGKIKDEIQKKAPNIAVGALAGLAIGPFGVVGNLLIGGGLGYLTSTDKFHKFLFGDENSDDPEKKKGLTGALHDKIISPIDNIMHNIQNSTTQWLKNMGKNISGRITSFFKDRVKRYKDGDKSILSKIIGGTDKVLKAPINMVGGALGKINDITTKGNLNKGYNVWNAEKNRNATAEEREQMREDLREKGVKNVKESSLDKAIASTDNKEDLIKLKEALKDLRILKGINAKEISELYKVLKENNVPSKIANKIEDYVKGDNGKTRAIEYLEKEIENSKKPGNDPIKIKNINKVIDAITKCNDAILSAKNDKNITKNTKQMLKDKFGLDVSDSDLMNGESLIDSELKNNEKFSDEKQQELKLDKHNNTVETYLDKILNAIHDVRGAGEDKFNQDNAGRITTKKSKDGKTLYRQIDENGDEHVISRENAMKILAENNDRSFKEKVYDTKETVGEGIKKGAQVTGDVIVESGKELGKAASMIVDSVKTLTSFIFDRLGTGADEAREAVKNARDASEYTGGKRSRAGRIIDNGKTGAEGFVKGVLGGSDDSSDEAVEEGSGSGIIRNISGGGSIGKAIKTIFTSNGPIQYIKNAQGESVVDKSDTETKNTLKKQDEFNTNIGSIGKISGLLGGFSGILSALKTGLLGDGEKKEGILSKLFSGLFGEDGALSGILSLFTGKSGSISSIVRSIVSNPAMLSGIFSGIIAPALLIGGFSGKLDNIGKAIGKISLLKGNDTQSALANNKSAQATTKDGSSVYLKINDDGSYATDDNGNYIDTNGNSIASSDIAKISETGSDTRISTQLKKNLLTGGINGAADVSASLAANNLKNATKYAANASLTSKVASKAGKTWGKALNKIAGQAIDSGLYNGIMANINKLLEKIPKILNNIPFLSDSVKNGSEEIVKTLYSNIDTAVKDAGKKGMSKLTSIATKLSKLLAVVQIAYVAAKGIDAWGNAGSILGITEEPTVGQREIATLVAVVNAAIPVIGDLIPNKTLVNIFMKIAPKIGIDVSTLQEERDAAQKEVEQFNEQNGTDLSIEEYNQAGWEYNEETGEYTQGKSRAGIFTKAGNKIKSAFATRKAKKATSSAVVTSGSGSGLGNTDSKFSEMFNNFLSTNDTFTSDSFKKDTSTFTKTMETLKKYAEDGKVQYIMSTNVEFSGDNPVSSLYSVGVQISKIFQTISAIIYNIVNPIKKVVTGVKDTVTKIKNSAFKTISNFVSNIFGQNSTSGSGSELISGGDSGFVSQYDPRYQQYKVSGQNFGAKGCGPAVAAMTANAFGKSLSVGDAVRASSGYQNAGGVTLDYFQNALGSKGINTEVISGGSSADMYSRIASGQKMILLGQDPTNTSKDFSPFGPNNHYVLATGVDRRGNVIVNDPESRGPRAYSPAILASAKYGVAGSNSGLKRTKIGRYISGGDSDTIASQIWYALKQTGFTDEAAAGILGNAQQESSMNPECDGAAYGLFQFEKGSSGTGEGYDYGDFLNYCKANGYSKSDPAAQIKFLFVDSYNGGGPYGQYTFETTPRNGKVGHYKNGNQYGISNHISWEDFKALTDIKTATEDWEYVYEAAGKPMMDKRIQYAKEYYTKFTGKSGTAISMSSSGTASTTSSSDSSSSGGVLGILSTLSNAFSNAFTGTLSSDSSSSSTTSSSTGTSGSVETADTSASTGGVAKSYPTGNGTASSFVDIARSQLGVIEGNSNITDYGKFLGTDGQAWCAAFVSWCMDKAFNGNSNKVKKALRGGTSASVSGLQSNFTNAGAMVGKNEAQAGDIVIYKNNGASHTGLVEAVDSDGKVHTIEGNTSGDNSYNRNGGMVARKEFYPNQKAQLTGFGRPDWAGAAAAGSGLMSYSDIANIAGGSSGLLIKSRPGSASAKGIAIRDPKSGRLVPIKLSGGASNVNSITTSMLNNVSSTAINKAKSGSVSSELVAQLLSSISSLLNSIANNTAPVEKIYNALVAYINSTSSGSGSGLDKVTVKKDNSNKKVDTSSTVDSNISTLVGVLAELAKG